MKALKFIALAFLVPLNLAAALQLVKVVLNLFFIKPNASGTNVSYGMGELVGALLLMAIVGLLLKAMLKSLKNG